MDYIAMKMIINMFAFIIVNKMIIMSLYYHDHNVLVMKKIEMTIIKKSKVEVVYLSMCLLCFLILFYF